MGKKLKIVIVAISLLVIGGIAIKPLTSSEKKQEETGETKKVGFIIEHGRKSFYDNGELKKGWLMKDEKTYYFNENGVAVIGEHNINGEKCVFNEEGELVSGKIVKSKK